MNNKEIICARSLARAFCYVDKDLTTYLPPYSEVIEVAKKVIHEEATCPAKMVRKSKKTPLRPKGGYSCEGTYVFIDPFDDNRGDIYECLRTTLRATYDEYERRKDGVIKKKKKITEHEKAVKALSDAFRNGIISGIEKYGRSYKAYYTEEEIQKEADFVLNEEQSDENLRWLAGTILHDKTKVEIPYPYTNKCPVYLQEYSAIGGELFLQYPRMSLYEALCHSASESYAEWFMENYQKVLASI